MTTKERPSKYLRKQISKVLLSPRHVKETYDAPSQYGLIRGNPENRLSRFRCEQISLEVFVGRIGGFTTRRMIEHLWRIRRLDAEATIDDMRNGGLIHFPTTSVDCSKLLAFTNSGWESVKISDGIAPGFEKPSNVADLNHNEILHTLQVQRAIIAHSPKRALTGNWIYRPNLGLSATGVSVCADAKIGGALIEVVNDLPDNEIPAFQNRLSVVLKWSYENQIELRYYCATEEVRATINAIIDAIRKDRHHPDYERTESLSGEINILIDQMDWLCDRL